MEIIIAAYLIIVFMFLCFITETWGNDIYAFFIVGICLFFSYFILYAAGFSIGSFFASRPLLEFATIIGYPVIGYAWALKRWEIFTNATLEDYYRFRDDNQGDDTKDLIEGFAMCRDFDFPLNSQQHFMRILLWLIMWPFSYITFLFMTVVSRRLVAIPRRLLSPFQDVADRCYSLKILFKGK